MKKDQRTIIWIVVAVVVIALLVWLVRRRSPTPETADLPTPAVSTETTVEASVSAGPDAESVLLATELVEAEFAQFGEGFTLQSLDYNEGMSTDPAELEYVNSLERGTFDQVIVFNSLFHTPASFEEITAWEPDIDYTWTWYVAHDINDGWQVVTYGY